MEDKPRNISGGASPRENSVKNLKNTCPVKQGDGKNQSIFIGIDISNYKDSNYGMEDGEPYTMFWT